MFCIITSPGLLPFINDVTTGEGKRLISEVYRAIGSDQIQSDAAVKTWQRVQILGSRFQVIPEDKGNEEPGVKTDDGKLKKE